MPEPDTLPISLPDGKVQSVPMPSIHFNATMLVSVDGQVVPVPMAVAHLQAHRDYWRQRADYFEQKAADALARLQAGPDG